MIANDAPLEKSTPEACRTALPLKLSAPDGSLGDPAHQQGVTRGGRARGADVHDLAKVGERGGKLLRGGPARLRVVVHGRAAAAEACAAWPAAGDRREVHAAGDVVGAEAGDANFCAAGGETAERWYAGAEGSWGRRGCAEGEGGAVCERCVAECVCRAVDVLAGGLLGGAVGDLGWGECAGG